MIQMLGTPSLPLPHHLSPLVGNLVSTTNLGNTMVKALDLFKLHFTDDLIGDIVKHTNTYAYIKLGEENSQHRSYRESNRGWWETTPEEILRLIALLIYFGLVRVVGDAVNIGALLLYTMVSGQDPSYPGSSLEPSWPYCMS